MCFTQDSVCRKIRWQQEPLPSPDSVLLKSKKLCPWLHEQLLQNLHLHFNGTLSRKVVLGLCCNVK